MAKRPRCRRPLRPYSATPPAIVPDPDPLCGRPEGHRGKCLSEDAWEREKARKNTPEVREARRARYAAARAAGATRGEAILAASRSRAEHPREAHDAAA